MDIPLSRIVSTIPLANKISVTIPRIDGAGVVADMLVIAFLNKSFDPYFSTNHLQLWLYEKTVAKDNHRTPHSFCSKNKENEQV
mmetsp:Transcript_51014/g.61449  ORF Transcript_51014/g.61449 Transcript_51014/m.61449 type:complete len:84 (+) Transcript_51014:2-253(+)